MRTRKPESPKPNKGKARTSKAMSSESGQAVKLVGASKIRLIRHIPNGTTAQARSAKSQMTTKSGDARGVIFAPGDASSSPRVKRVLADVVAQVRAHRGSLNGR